MSFLFPLNSFPRLRHLEVSLKSLLDGEEQDSEGQKKQKLTQEKSQPNETISEHFWFLFYTKEKMKRLQGCTVNARALLF